MCILGVDFTDIQKVSGLIRECIREVDGSVVTGFVGCFFRSFGCVGISYVTKVSDGREINSVVVRGSGSCISVVVPIKGDIFRKVRVRVVERGCAVSDVGKVGVVVSLS